MPWIVLWALGCGASSSVPASPQAAGFDAPTNVAPQDAFDPVMAAVCQAGCATKIDYAPEDVVAQPDASVGDLVQCPVSGVVFEVKPGQPYLDHDGHTTYTCCGGCLGKLEVDPARFLGG